MSQLDLHQLALQLAADGPDAHGDELSAVAEWAHSAGASPVLAAIVACADDPPIARLRAFGLLARVLDDAAARTEPQLAA